LAIGNACSYSYGARLAIEDNLVEVGQGDLILGAVGDPIKGVSSAQRSQFAAALHYLLYLFDGLRLMQSVGAVGVIS
jgi:hypothetical protein